MGKADLAKAGGILAFVASIMQFVTVVAIVFVMLGWRRVFDELEDDLWFWVSFVFAYATMVLSTLLISGAKSKIPGIALILCTILGAFSFQYMLVYAPLILTGGILSLAGSGGAGGVLAAAKRMAKAAQEPDANDKKD